MTSPTSFAVTGVSGHVGGAVARALLAEGRRVRVLTGDPARLHALDGAEVVRGGFADAAAVRTLVTSADGLFVVSLPGGEERLALHEAVLRAAAAADVAHVVVLSFLRPSPDATFPQGRWDALTRTSRRTPSLRSCASRACPRRSCRGCSGCSPTCGRGASTS